MSNEGEDAEGVVRQERSKGGLDFGDGTAIPLPNEGSFIWQQIKAPR